jgi:hypothetical protein
MRSQQIPSPTTIAMDANRVTPIGGFFSLIVSGEKSFCASKNTIEKITIGGSSSCVNNAANSTNGSSRRRPTPTALNNNNKID